MRRTTPWCAWALASASIPLIAKVESAQAVDNLEGIVDAAEGVMVARGDLGVELDLELIPAVQREIIRRAGKDGVGSPSRPTSP